MVRGQYKNLYRPLDFLFSDRQQLVRSTFDRFCYNLYDHVDIFVS